jgi:hypothetical protein
MTATPAETLAALGRSIAHWERNVAAETPDQASVYAPDCALCDLFHKFECYDCPVMADTGRAWCSGSPYSAAARSYRRWCDDPTPENHSHWRRLATDELDYLRGLREMLAAGMEQSA